MTELRINFWPHTKKIEDDKQGVEQEEDGDDDAYILSSIEFAHTMVWVNSFSLTRRALLLP